jgi:hypothetical protein
MRGQKNLFTLPTKAEQKQNKTNRPVPLQTHALRETPCRHVDGDNGDAVAVAKTRFCRYVVSTRPNVANPSRPRCVIWEGTGGSVSKQFAGHFAGHFASHFAGHFAGQLRDLCLNGSPARHNTTTIDT